MTVWVMVREKRTENAEDRHHSWSFQNGFLVSDHNPPETISMAGGLGRDGIYLIPLV